MATLVSPALVSPTPLRPAAPSPPVAIRRLPAGRLAALVQDTVADARSWRRLVRYDAAERFALLLDRDETRDLWLLTWLPGQGTGIHDHGGSTGAFAVAHGALREVRPHPVRTSARLRAGAVRVVPDGVLHDVHNPGRAPAVSIHAYSPPLETMTRYGGDLSPRALEPVRTDVGHPR